MIDPVDCCKKKCQSVVSMRDREADRMTNIATPTPTKNPRKSRRVYDFPPSVLENYFHLSQRVAAGKLGVAPITIKRSCKRHGITWPYRITKAFEAQTRKCKRRNSVASSSSSLPSISSSSSSSPRAIITRNVERDWKDQKNENNGESILLEMSAALEAFMRLPVECMLETKAQEAGV